MEHVPQKIIVSALTNLKHFRCFVHDKHAQLVVDIAKPSCQADLILPVTGDKVV